MGSRIRQHLKTNVVGYVALFFALGLGTAWALENDSVKSKHIKDDQVKTADVRDSSLNGGGLEGSDIDPGAIGPAQLDLGLHGFVSGEGTTTSDTPVGLGASIGPIVTIDVPQDALVAVYATAQIERTGGTACNVHLAETELPPGGTAQLFTSNASSYTAKFTAPGTSSQGTSEFTDGGWLMFPATPGPHTYTMKYSTTTGASCAFKNRELAVGAVG